MSFTSEQAAMMLREHGIRSTPLAFELLKLLSESPVPATAKILHAALSHRRADLASVHRLLIKGEQAGLFRTVRFQDRSQWYEMAADSPHYHHLFCTHCRRIERLRYCLARELKEAALREMGFEVLSHKTEMYGICRNCRKNQSSNPCSKSRQSKV